MSQPMASSCSSSPSSWKRGVMLWFAQVCTRRDFGRLLGIYVVLVCFILALRHLGTARTSAYFSFAPFLGASISILAFAEPLTPRFLVAGGLMASGLYLHLAERHEHLHVHEPMAHEHRHVHDAHHQHAHGPNDPPGEPHTHWHEHERLVHSHPHYPDIHHRHDHEHPR